MPKASIKLKVDISINADGIIEPTIVVVKSIERENPRPISNE